MPRLNLTWTWKSAAAFVAGLLILSMLSLLVLAEVYGLPHLARSVTGILLAAWTAGIGAGGYFLGLEAGYRKSRDQPPLSRENGSVGALRELHEMADSARRSRNPQDDPTTHDGTSMLNF